MIQACSLSSFVKRKTEKWKQGLWKRVFNILSLLGIIVYEGWGKKRPYSQVPCCSLTGDGSTCYTGVSFFKQCCTSLRSGSVSGLEVSVVVEELSSSAKESFSSSSCCFPFPLLSFSSRFFCGLVFRWSVFPFPGEIRTLRFSAAVLYDGLVHFILEANTLKIWS